MNLGFQDQTLGIYEQVALSALDLLAFVVTALFSSRTGALDLLAIYYASARLRVTLLAHSQTMAQSGVYPFPGAVYAPGPEVMVDGLPGWEVVRQ